MVTRGWLILASELEGSLSPALDDSQRFAEKSGLMLAAFTAMMTGAEQNTNGNFAPSR